MAVSAWLVFLIVRRHTDWRPAAWIGAALFLALVDIHRFPGGFPRAFIQPAVLLTVLLALQRRELAAALVAAGAALFYPPAALLAVGVLFLSGLRPLDRRRIGFALLAGALAAAAVLIPEAIDGGAPRVFTAAQARAYPEFGAHGGLHFFVVVAARLPAPEPQRVRPPRAGEHPLPGGARAAARAAGQRAPAARRGVGDAGRVAALLRRRAGGAVPALPAAPLHVSADPVLRDRRRGAAAADVGRARRARRRGRACRRGLRSAAARPRRAHRLPARAARGARRARLARAARGRGRRRGRGGRGRRAPERRARGRADRRRARRGDPRRLGPARARLALPDAAGRRVPRHACRRTR